MSTCLESLLRRAGVPGAVREMLAIGLGPSQPVVRSELFGAERFARHGRSLAATHRADQAGARASAFFPRLRSNIQVLRLAQRCIELQAAPGGDEGPAAEWLLDNFHLIEAQFREIEAALPRGYFRRLPVLLDEPLAGLPRVYGVAWAYVAHSDSEFDEDLLVEFLTAYQETRALDLAEMWALPITLRVVLVENLRRLAERVATEKAARALANSCCDHIEGWTADELDVLLAGLTVRGAERVFMLQMAQRLRGRSAALNTAAAAWLARVLPEGAAIRAQLAADQTSDNLSVSNAVNSLRIVGEADWGDIVACSSPLMRLMMSTDVFKAEHAATRDQSLHEIERLAHRSGLSEMSIGECLASLVAGAPDRAHPSAAPGYWLRGEGRQALLHATGARGGAWPGLRRSLSRWAAVSYLTLMAAGTLALTAIAMWPEVSTPPAPGSASWLTPGFALASLLCLFPASEVVIAVMNRLVSESARPRSLPRLSLASGVPDSLRTLVVIPALLTDRASIARLVHRLRLHYLANREPNAQYALLTDWTDAPARERDADRALLEAALAGVQEIEKWEASGAELPDAPPRFLLLHRERVFSQTQQCWLGWDRKRGKLEQLLDALARNGTDSAEAADAGVDTAYSPAAFMDLGRHSRVVRGTRYVLTLDSDTELPAGALRALVGVAAHPTNQARLDAAGVAVERGFGIFQPRVSMPLAAPDTQTAYRWLSSGDSGNDLYGAAASEVYQDLFGEGTFQGKGLLDVRIMQAVLAGRMPPERILSHDLLEGVLVRCAAVNDVFVVEDSPTHADVAASRMHRWIRGDWQLLPTLLQPGRHRLRLRLIDRWKLSDNLRRSLVAPASLALVWSALMGFMGSPWPVLALVIAAAGAGPLLGALAGFSASRDHIGLCRFHATAACALARALATSLWQLAQLQRQSSLAIDAIARTLYRMTVSRRALLQWTTAESAQSGAEHGLGALLRRHWQEPVIAATALSIILATNTEHALLAIVGCAVWAGAPCLTWLASRPPAAAAATRLSTAQRDYLWGIARDTWRLFERCVGPDDRHLPPDNLQVLPGEAIAHRTSPTNIGLYLLSAVCARQFGWISTPDLLRRLEATLASVHSLARHRGHLYNWYHTQTGEPLLPLYVSTVDSGNLSGHLLAVAAACRALAAAPHDRTAGEQAIVATARRVAGCAQGPARTTSADEEPLEWLARTHRLPADAALTGAPAFGARLQAAESALAALDALDEPEAELEPPGDSTPSGLRVLALPDGPSQRVWLLRDHLAALRAALEEERAGTAEGSVPARQRLLAVAIDCEGLAWAPDFAFLYHRKRKLLHIGYRVAEQQLDAGFYDLLASESRSTSLVAIAKGDVPTVHWAALGRPFYLLGCAAGLRSWSGSMFEYLMPSLIMHEPAGSALHGACVVALREQVAFGRAQSVPWGVSECAYSARDQSLAYQYGPQGVPRAALRRTPLDELVVAPYASALAAMLAPQRACDNLMRLERLGARGRYGFIDALDFTPARRDGTAPFVPVATFMAHHQGMTVAALANVLLDNPVQRWGGRNARIEAFTSMLHERAPREIDNLFAPPDAAPSLPLRRHAPALRRDVAPGGQAIEPTQVMSNGCYTVAIRANGAGSSRFGDVGINRTRDDALRDAHGSFLYLRAAPGQRPVSITQHPAPDPLAQYDCVFYADRVCFEATWTHRQACSTVWVSPEDDVEFREVRVSNLGQTAIEVELISAFEVALATAAADEAHPVFGNLFVSACWDARHQALVFERRARLDTEPAVHMAHFIAGGSQGATEVGIQTDRARWLGRNRAVASPLALLEPAPGARAVSGTSDDDAPAAAEAGGAHRFAPLDTGLDPVCALSVRLRIAPGAVALVTIATAVASDAGTLDTLVDKYRQASHVRRTSLMSATLSGIRLRELRTDAAGYAAMQTLTSALVSTLTRPETGAAAGAVNAETQADRKLLWRVGISGDRPILLVSICVLQGLGMLRALSRMLRFWAWSGIACDLVVLNSEPGSYHMTLEREIMAMREHHLAETRGCAQMAQTALHVLRAEALTQAEVATLQALARVRFVADGRTLQQRLQEWIGMHEQAFDHRHETSRVALALPPDTDVTSASQPIQAMASGSFSARSGAFAFDVGPELRPARPWINVLASPKFGTQVSEAGGGYTWAQNSRLFQLTAWSNDPVADPASEWYLLQDLATLELWNVCPAALGRVAATYRVTHAKGVTTIEHTWRALHVIATWCVDADEALKHVSIRITNRGEEVQRLRVIGLVEWMLGARRADRSTVSTAMRRHVDEVGVAHPVLLATQTDHAAGFGGATGLFWVTGGDGALEDWTCDRRELFDARGRLVVPDRFGQLCGLGADPCAALGSELELAPGATRQRVFVLACASDAASAIAMVERVAPASAAHRQRLVSTRWSNLLAAVSVATPDPLYDALVNHWLLYQTVACRMYAKAGFYQAGGATGFRDQLQDAMALSWAEPSLLAAQIEIAASRQFTEGDVQHWWHAPDGAGVRTHCSDDRLWLPFACTRYVQSCGDRLLLDRIVPFILGPALAAEQEDAYFVPQVSAETASIYEHAARAIDRSLASGVHGLPLIGGGDWNDGMNRVGHLGRGESVWLAWFLLSVVEGFAPIARARDDQQRALRWEAAATGWLDAIERSAWDGEWYRRGFFDNGEALGGADREEAQIDLVAQAWAVLCGRSTPQRQRAAMRSADQRLFDPRDGLIRLLDPPFLASQPSPGYIQAYPPGVRENGGQYSHAAIWAMMAHAACADGTVSGGERGDAVYRYFCCVSPAHRAAHPRQGTRYGLEPYAVAGDICSQPPHAGRGGWSWYTGAAGWLHRAAIESMFGLDLRAESLCFVPCLPSHWPRAELTLRREARVLRFILLRATEEQAVQEALATQGRVLAVGQLLHWKRLAGAHCFVIPLAD